MNKFKQVFKNRHVVLPVIHCDKLNQTLQNIKIAKDEECDGVFLINHGMSPEELIGIYRKARFNYPENWIGLNLLGVPPYKVFELIDNDVDGIWTDNAMIDEHDDEQPYSNIVLDKIKKSAYKGLYFGGFAFKYQRKVLDLEMGAVHAVKYMDVVTTSGEGTGLAADIEKIRRIKNAVGDFPLAIASGISPENIKNYLPFADCFLVATGISKSWTELDEEKLRELMNEVRNYK